MTQEAPDAVFSSLQPATVWAHFATGCAIPRPSKAEGPLREHLRRWAEARGLATSVDAAGNLLIRKHASPGREGAPGERVEIASVGKVWHLLIAILAAASDGGAPVR